MAETPRVVTSEEASGGRAETVGWGLLLIWTGMVLLMGWGWGLGLLGAGAIVLGAQAWRRHLGLRWELFGVLCGSLLLLCGVWVFFDVAVELVPLLCIAGGIALLVSTWTAHRPRAPGGRPDLPAPSHPRA